MELFNDQNYASIRKKYLECGVPWTDPTFTATETSIGLSKVNSLAFTVHWKRPFEIVKGPKLFVDGASSRDMTQGQLGNCWVVATCSVLAGNRDLWSKVIPDWESQVCDPETDGYSGVFRFRFWKFGKWVEVLVDDLVPTEKVNSGEFRPVFSHSSQKTEFWGALLEKAYAKLHGSYAALDGGNLSDAMVDFTGGVVEAINLEAKQTLLEGESEEKKRLFRTLEVDIEENCALLCAGIKASSPDEMEKQTELGLVRGHAYGITAVRRIPLGEANLVNFFKGREKLMLIRLQNPWGQKEWKGPFSDGSPEWISISEKEREKLGLNFRDDGEFWMPFDDFLTHFTELSICRIINTSSFTLLKTWKEVQLFGAWATNVPTKGKDPPRNLAGGCLNHQDTFLENPQYRFDVAPVEDPSDETKHELIIQLSQHDGRPSILGDSKDPLVVGFHIMRVENNRRYRVHKLIPGSAVATSDYVKARHIFLRTTMPRSGGRFVLVPTTFNPNETKRFMLRVFTERAADVQELSEDYPELNWCQSCFSQPYAVVTRLTVKGATNLCFEDKFGTCDPYVYIKCEGYTERSPTVIKSLNPQWEFCVIFYRKDPSQAIKIQVWNHNYVKDTFMGQAFVLAAPMGTDPAKIETFSLVGRKNQRSETLPGELKVQMETYEMLNRL